jgi:hypothetical protein
VTVIAGWYPDPTNSSGLRFWDGQVWTAQTAPAAIAQPRDGNEFAAAGIAGHQQAPAQPVTSHQATAHQAATYFDQPAYSARSATAPGSYSQPPNERYVDTHYDRSRRRPSTGGIVKWVLIAVAIFVLLPIVAAVAIPVFLNSKTKDLSHRTSIAMPDSMAGMVKKNDDISQELADYYDTHLPASYIHLTGVYSQVDGDPGAVVAIVEHAFYPAQISGILQESERSYSSSVSSASSVGPFHNVDPGSLGGTMRCASVVFKGLEGTVCAFADPAAYGIITTYQPDDLAVVLKLRAAVELRS